MSKSGITELPLAAFNEAQRMPEAVPIAWNWIHQLVSGLAELLGDGERIGCPRCKLAQALLGVHLGWAKRAAVTVGAGDKGEGLSVIR